MELHPDETVFLGEIEADLSDDTARLVYADWLEERGDPRGEYLRIEVELASGDGAIENLGEAIERVKRLKENIDPSWLAIVSRSAIEGCHSHFLESRNCPGRWRGLPRTDEPLIRLCEQCQTAVQFCTSVPEAKYFLRRQNSKVAIDSGCERVVNDLEYRRGEGTTSQVQDPGVDSELADELLTRLLRAEAMLIDHFGDQASRSRRNWVRNWWSD